MLFRGYSPPCRDSYVRAEALTPKELFGRMEFVEDGFGEAAESEASAGFGGEHIEDDDFVFADAKEGRGEIESLLRADVPDAAERVAVDPDDAFREGARVEERVA